jgi:hypothetical protein
VENVIIKFTADTTGLQPAVEQLKLIGKITDEDARKIEEINQSQARYLNTLKKTTQEAGNFGDELAHIKAEIQAGILEGIAEYMKQFGDETEKTTKKTKSIKQELKELKAQIASGGLDGKQLREATKRAGELADAIADANQQVKAFEGNRFERILTRFGEAARASAAGMSVLTGASALFGSENEDLSKALLKAQASMALLQGTQELTMLLQKESALMIGLMEAKTYALAASQRVATVASRALGVEITASMAAATMGISLVAAALAYLVVELSTTEESTKKIQERLTKMYEKDKEVYEKVLQKRLELLKGSKEDELKALQIAYNHEFRLRLQEKKKTGQSQESFDAETILNAELFNLQVAEINKKYADKELKDLKEQEEKKRKAKEDANNKALQEQLAMLKEQAALQEILIRNTSGDARVKAFEELTKIKKKEIDLDKSMGVFQKQLQKTILEDELIDFAHKEQKRLELAEKGNEAELDFYQDTANKKAEIDTKYLEEKAKKEEEYRQLAQQTAIQILENTASFAFSQIEQNLQQETDLKVAAAEEEQRKQLEGRELSASQQQAIERNTQREIARIKTEAARKQRQADVVQASINGAIAITKAYATMDPISASIAAVGIATLTGLQIAAIKNQPIPKFAKGTKGVEGPGTDTSDSILAYLSKGEMVIPTKTKESYFPALDLIFDKKVSPSIANELLLEASKGNYNISHDYNSPVYVNSSVAIDYDKLDKLFSKNKSTTNINMDESGFRKFLITENGKNEYLNKKFRK